VTVVEYLKAISYTEIALILSSCFGCQISGNLAPVLYCSGLQLLESEFFVQQVVT